MVRVNITDRILVEPFGEELVVFDHTSSEIARFTGDHAAILRQVQDGETVDIESSPALHELLNSGVVVKAGTFSRRKALTLGAGAVGAGVISLSLPSMALAQSVSVQEVPFGFDLKGFEIQVLGNDLQVQLGATVSAPDDATTVTFFLAVNGVNDPIEAATVTGAVPVDFTVTFNPPGGDTNFFTANTAGAIFWERGGVQSDELALNWQSPPA